MRRRIGAKSFLGKEEPGKIVAAPEGLLGVQSLQPGALDNDSTTCAAIFGVDVNLTHSLMLSGSATMAKTASATGQTLAMAPGGLNSTAAEIGVTKSGLFNSGDRGPEE